MEHKFTEKKLHKFLAAGFRKTLYSGAKINIHELVKSAYSRVTMLPKLKYTGINLKDLLEIYALFLGSRAEYMSVAWHSSLTVAEDHKFKKYPEKLYENNSL